MTHCLPPSLQRLFEPRGPLPFLVPLDRDPDYRRGPSIDPVSNYLEIFGESRDIPPTSIFVAPHLRRRQKVDFGKGIRH